MKALIPMERIESRIYLIRERKVMIDVDLAELYDVKTGNLNLAVRRNLERFPEDFAFQLTREEADNLRLQTAISSWGGRRYLPYVFTQEGIAMLSSVLRSPRAVQMNILIMRVFVRLRKMLGTHKELAHKLEELEKKIGAHDTHIQTLFEAIRQLMEPPAPPPEDKRRIGYRVTS